jgi:hypothetical protein
MMPPRRPCCIPVAWHPPIPGCVPGIPRRIAPRDDTKMCRSEARGRGIPMMPPVSPAASLRPCALLSRVAYRVSLSEVSGLPSGLNCDK